MPGYAFREYDGHVIIEIKLPDLECNNVSSSCSWALLPSFTMQDQATNGRNDEASQTRSRLRRMLWAAEVHQSQQTQIGSMPKQALPDLHHCISPWECSDTCTEGNKASCYLLQLPDLCPRLCHLHLPAAPLPQHCQPQTHQMSQKMGSQSLNLTLRRKKMHHHHPVGCTIIAAFWHCDTISHDLMYLLHCS